MRPGNWEVTAGVQHELLPRLGLEATYFRRSYFNFYATQNQAYNPSDYQTFSVTTPSIRVCRTEATRCSPASMI